MFNRPLHITLAAAISALAVAGAALPAQAATGADQPVAMKKEQRNGRTVYCVDQTNTGSRVPQRVCLTKSEWNNRGAIINDNDQGVAEAGKSRANPS